MRRRFPHWTVLAIVALVAAGCSGDDAPSGGVLPDDDGPDAAPTVDGFGCAAEFGPDGDVCEFVASDEVAADAELWLWVQGDGSATSETSSDPAPGSCSNSGGGVCLNVQAVAPGDEVRCSVEGAGGTWGCSIQPGGPEPPAEVRAVQDRTDELRRELEDQLREGGGPGPTFSIPDTIAPPPPVG